MKLPWAVQRVVLCGVIRNVLLEIHCILLVMNLDPGLVCYQHCKSGRLFAFKTPEKCNFCNNSIDDLIVPPFSVPYPFVRASQTTCCIVIKPTKGDFLHDYSNTSDLHIGVTNKSGTVHEFSSEGLHSDYTSSWNQSLAVPVLTDSISIPPDPVWQEYWEFTLSTLTQEESWTEDSYNEDHHNCYTFVMKFLEALRPPGMNTKNLNKMSFCSAFIIPYTSVAAKYITLYRQTKEVGVISVPKTNSKIEYAGPIQTTAC